MDETFGSDGADDGRPDVKLSRERGERKRGLTQPSATGHASVDARSRISAAALDE